MTLERFKKLKGGKNSHYDKIRVSESQIVFGRNALKFLNKGYVQVYFDVKGKKVLFKNVVKSELDAYKLTVMASFYTKGTGDYKKIATVAARRIPNGYYSFEVDGDFLKIKVDNWEGKND